MGFKRKSNILLLFLVIWSFMSCQKPGEDKPNVLLIITDDQGWGDLSVNGNTILETPVLDMLSQESVIFDRFYVSPVCAPTRASLLTGRYHLRTGTSWVTHRLEVMRPEEYTLAESFKNNGYITGCFGKWHNGEQYPTDPYGQGFDEFFGFKAGHWNNYFDTWLEDQSELVKTKGYITDVLTDKAIRFISHNKNHPFFCYIPYNAPHGPFQVPDTFYETYKNMGLDSKTACIYGMCENLDLNIGRLLQTIDSLGLTNNTIVLFLTDNGPNSDRYNGNMKGRKGSVDEGGIRVPLFIRYPDKLEGGTVIETITSHIDLFPTLHELCNIPFPDTLVLDGISLVPLMEGKSLEKYKQRMIFTHQVNREFKSYPGSVRTSTYRLVLDGKKDTLLYNMTTDPEQTTNITKAQPDITMNLLKAYNSWLEEVTKHGISPPLIHIGYYESPVTRLPAPEAELTGNLTFKGKTGWANDWIINFLNENDSASWPILVIQDGQYSIHAELALQTSTFPVDVSISTQKERMTKKLYDVITAPVVASPDRVERGEVYERKWQKVDLGTINLTKGKDRITFSVSEAKDYIDIELKAIYVKNIKQ